MKHTPQSVSPIMGLEEFEVVLKKFDPQFGWCSKHNIQPLWVQQVDCVFLFMDKSSIQVIINNTVVLHFHLISEWAVCIISNTGLIP